MSKNYEGGDKHNIAISFPNVLDFEHVVVDFAIELLEQNGK